MCESVCAIAVCECCAPLYMREFMSGVNVYERVCLSCVYALLSMCAFVCVHRCECVHACVCAFRLVCGCDFVCVRAYGVVCANIFRCLFQFNCEYSTGDCSFLV